MKCLQTSFVRLESQSHNRWGFFMEWRAVYFSCHRSDICLQTLEVDSHLLRKSSVLDCLWQPDQTHQSSNNFGSLVIRRLLHARKSVIFQLFYPNLNYFMNKFDYFLTYSNLKNTDEAVIGKEMKKLEDFFLFHQHNRYAKVYSRRAVVFWQENWVFSSGDHR